MHSTTVFVFLATLAVVAVYPSAGQEDNKRPCIRNGAAMRLFDGKCFRPTPWKIVKDDDEERVRCRCIGLTIKLCQRCVYRDVTTTSPSPSPSEGTTSDDSDASTTEGSIITTEEPEQSTPDLE